MLVGWFWKAIALEADVESQLAALALHVFVNVVLRFGVRGAMDPWIRGRPWFRKAMLRSQQQHKGSLDLDLPLPVIEELYLSIQPSLVQHCIGGALCLPRVLGAGPSSLVLSLVRHGATSEIGWEIVDTAERLYLRWIVGGDAGKGQCNTVLFILLSHHILASTMAVPMNLGHAGVWDYAALTCVLQLAAAVALSLQQYTLGLDVEEPGQMRQMQVLSVVKLTVLFGCRGIVFGVLVKRVLGYFYAQAMFGTVGAGIFAVLGMQVVNLVLIIDAALAVHKWVIKKMPKVLKGTEHLAVPLVSRRLTGSKVHLHDD